MTRSLLFGQPLSAVVVGPDLFTRSLAEQGVPVTSIDWRPPAWGEPDLARGLADLLADERVEQANRTAAERLRQARTVLTDVRPARELLPVLAERALLHAGPPIDWDRMSGPVQGAVVGALLYEGWANDEASARQLAASGDIRFAPCHEHASVGPMAGIVSPSMPMFVVENQATGNRAHVTINEGLGRVLRYGAYAPEVIDRLRWMARVLSPAIGEAVRRSGGIDSGALIAQALQMGDECHNRNRALSLLLLRQLLPGLADLGLPAADLAEIVRFIGGNEHFGLNLSMATCKAMLDSAHGIEHATVVTAMARNGTDFGIRISGLGNRWFTAPASVVEGLYFPGFGPADANPDLGDSAITETCGLGAAAMAAAPAIVQFVGGSVADAVQYTLDAHEIALAESEKWRIPSLDFRGTAVGVDLRLVARTGILPTINTGIAHREPGIGQIGAGIVRPPVECFIAALRAFLPPIHLP